MHKMSANNSNRLDKFHISRVWIVSHIILQHFRLTFMCPCSACHLSCMDFNVTRKHPVPDPASSHPFRPPAVTLLGRLVPTPVSIPLVFAAILRVGLPPCGRSTLAPALICSSRRLTLRLLLMRLLGRPGTCTRSIAAVVVARRLRPIRHLTDKARA